MNPLAKKDRIAEMERICRERSLPCTLQRRLIFEAMLELEDHPSADHVFQYVSRQHRGVSRATVHRTLETLVQLGLITKACNPGRAVRYDARTENHHHLVCLRCNKMIDIQVEPPSDIPFPDTAATGFEVSDYRVQFRGLCSECRQQEERKSNEH